MSIQTNQKVLQVIAKHVSHLRRPEGVALPAGRHLRANVKRESAAHLSCSWGEGRPISLRICLFDALMKCWNLAKRDRYNSSRLIVLDAYLCQPSVWRTRVGPENTHANDGNLRVFYLFVTTGKRRKRRCNRRRRKRRKMGYRKKGKNLWQDERQKEVTAQDGWRAAEVSLEGEAKAHKMSSRRAHK